MYNLFSFILLFFLCLCMSSQSEASSLLGVSFGSPTLVGVRGAYHWDESPWAVQTEYSRQVLYRNRTNGLLKVLRLNAQWEYLDSEGIVPFYFVGLDHFSGYFNQETSSISLVASEVGTGLRLEITERLLMTSELGLIVPLQAVKGFEHVGLVINLALMFRFGFGS